jgi:hypothetical protein
MFILFFETSRSETKRLQKYVRQNSGIEIVWTPFWHGVK